MKRLTRAQAIREKCLDCSNGSAYEVRNCPIKRCTLWRFRMGKEEKDKLYYQAMNNS